MTVTAHRPVPAADGPDAWIRRPEASPASQLEVKARSDARNVRTPEGRDGLVAAYRHARALVDEARLGLHTAARDVDLTLDSGIVANHELLATFLDELAQRAEAGDLWASPSQLARQRDADRERAEFYAPVVGYTPDQVLNIEAAAFNRGYKIRLAAAQT